jgi:hypothetical protein
MAIRCRRPRRRGDRPRRRVDHAELRKRTSHAQTSVTISLFSGYDAFIPANAIGASGVLAAVTTGLYMGIRGPSIIPARIRLQVMFVRERRFAARAGKIEDDGYEDRSLQYQHVVQLVLAAQREALVRLRNSGEISNETMNHVIQELDLEESRLEI